MTDAFQFPDDADSQQSGGFAFPDDSPADVLRQHYQQQRVSSDAYAKARADAKAAGLPVPTALSSPEDVAFRASEPDWKGFATKAPATSKRMASSVELFNLAKDDTAGLSQLEYTIGDLGRDVSGSIAAGGNSLLSMANFLGSWTPPLMVSDWLTQQLTGADPREQRRQYLAGARESTEAFKSDELQAQNRAVQQAEGFGGTVQALVDNPGAAADFIGQQLPQLGIMGKVMQGAMAGKAGAEALSMAVRANVAVSGAMGGADAGTQAEQSMYEYAKKNGASDEEAAALSRQAGMYAFAIGAPLSAAIARIGAGVEAKIAGQMLGNDAARMTVGEAVRQAPATVAKEFAEESLDEGLGSQMSSNVGEILAGNEQRGVMDRVPESAAIGGVLGGAFGIGGAGLQVGGAVIDERVGRVVAQKEKERQSAVRGIAEGERIGNLLDVAASLKLKENAPDLMADLVAGLAQDVNAPTELYIDAADLTEALNQSGITVDRFAEMVPSVADKVADAIMTDGVVAIPLADIATKVAGSELDRALRPHLRATVDGMPPAKAQEFMQGYQKELQAEAERVLTEVPEGDKFKESAARLEEMFVEQIAATGTRSRSAAEAEAKLAVAPFVALAGRWRAQGDAEMTPEAFFQRITEQRAALNVQGPASQAPMGPVLNEQYDQDTGQLKTDTPEFRAWFGDSKVVDADGKPLVVYHGTRRDISEFRSGSGGTYGDGIYFTRHSNEASIYAGMEPSDTGGAVYPAYIKIENPAPEDVASEIESKFGGDTSKELQRLGYDGIITDYEVVAFRPEQIKSVFNRGTWDPADPNILNQSPSEGPRLSSLHNLSAENLAFADKMGGIAVPSIGVVTESAGGVEGFGEITLIGTKDMADPSAEPVFSSDAYTARFPRPIYKPAKTKDADKLVAFIRPWAEKFDDADAKYRAWENTHENPDPQDLISRALRSRAWIGAYLDSIGVDVDPVMRDVPMYSGLQPEHLDILRPLYEAVGDQKSAGEILESPEFAALSKKAGEVLADFYAEIGMTGEKYSAATLSKNFGFGAYDRLGRDLRNAGKREMDPWATLEKMQAAVKPHASDFKKFVEEKVLPMMGEPMLRVGRKKVPYTLSNIVDYMTSEKVRGEEKTMTYGAGMARSATAERFVDLERMREVAKNTIVDVKGYNAKKKETDALLSDYRDKVAEYYNGSTWDAMDSAMKAIARWGTGNVRGKPELVASLKKEGFKAGSIPGDVIDLAVKAGNALLDAPVPYFEAKPQRAVTLDAFAGAVIPDNASAEVRAILDKHGIKYREYSEDAGRTSAVREFTKELSSGRDDVLFQDPKGPRATFNPATMTIRLAQQSDLSSFIHEGGHAFLEVMAMAAGMPDAPVSVQRDMQAILDWFGIPNSPDVPALQYWNSMTLDEKRPYHEKWAESFEQYMLEGKAPSLELASAFARFRDWMISVYQSVKRFMAVNTNASLNDDIRAVMDRMLATDEQIAEAQAARAMFPLFASKPEWMTPEEWRDYQSLVGQSTDEAKQQLDARRMRDMKWLRGRYGKLLKQMQKDVAEKRRAMRVEAAREILSQPVYMARSFLTGKMEKAAKAKGKGSKSVDPSVDTMLVAIAKMGGLNRDEAVAQFGLDPADFKASPLFGKPVLRREGGMMPDEAVERLAEMGYLPTDDNGKADMRELETFLHEEARGNPRYSIEADYNLLQPEERFTPTPAQSDLVDNPQLAGRLDVGWMLERYGRNNPAVQWERLGEGGRRGMVAKEGMDPDAVAELFGFSSGDQMVRALIEAEDPRTAIDRRTDQMLLERYGDITSEAAMASAVDQALNNGARARLIATELAGLQRATGSARLMVKAAKEFASAKIAGLKVRDLKPRQYQSAEARAAKAADKAFRDGDQEVAAANKRSQLLNNQLARAAQDGLDEAAAIRREWSEFSRKSDDKLGKSYDLDLVNVVRVILGEYGFAPKRAEKAAQYLTRVKQYDPDIYEAVQQSVAAAEANAKDFREMTLGEMRALKDEVEAILHLARRSKTMEVDGDLLDRRDVEQALLNRMAEIGVPESGPGEKSAITRGEQAAAQFRTALAALTRVESWVNMMDGPEAMGPFRRFIFQRVKDAADAYRADKAKYLSQYRDLLDRIAPTLKAGLIDAPELGYTFGKDVGGSGMAEVLHAILHTGNDSNKRKMLLGRGWATLRPDDTLDTARWDSFLARLAREGVLVKEHYDFAQGVWDLLESMKPMAQRAHRDAFGKYFDEVTASPVQSPFGVYRGGYVPAKADPRVVKDAQLRAIAEDERQGLQFAFPSTPKGFTKSRVEYNRPLLLDLRSLSSHIDQVLLFSHLEIPVRDVRKVIMGVGGTLELVQPQVIGGMLQPWLSRAATQQVATPIPADAGLSRFLGTMRSRAGMAAMFGNLVNAMQQLTGFSLASLKVKPALMMRAAAEYGRSPRAFAEAVAAASPYMKGRMENQVAAMSDDINEILLNPTLLQKAGAWTMRHAYFLQSAFDNVMSPIIWQAAYNQHIEAGAAHDDAVRLADSAVRETQGSTLPEDVSRIESGNAFVRLFTQFAGYFNMQANLLRTEFARMMGQAGLTPQQRTAKGLYIFTMGFMIPAVVAELIVQAFRGGPDDEDKDGEYLDDWLASLFIFAPLRNATAMVPVVGQGVNAAVNAANSKPYDDRIATSPAISMLESAARAPVSVANAAAGDGSAQKAVRDVGTLLSMTFGVPASFAARPAGYWAGVADGKIDPTGPVDAARGTVTGFASADSK